LRSIERPDGCGQAPVRARRPVVGEAVDTIERVLRQFHHRETSARSCEGVDLASCGLLSGAQLSQCGFPRLLIGNRRNRNRLAGTVCGGLR
jgi:hypothetical protein